MAAGLGPDLRVFSPEGWPDYALLDSGGREKLERFGAQVLWRPEPQALWPKTLPESGWQQQAHARFNTEQGEKGEWQLLKPKTQPKWWMPLPFGAKAKLSLSSFRHVGLFPEQEPNWRFIDAQTKRFEQPRVLNLFAYTGAGSMAARAAGAYVTHVEAIKHTMGWAAENADGNRMDGLSWVVEDAAKFVEREARRGKTYQGIILDPPAYGRGPKGEKWTLEEDLPTLLENCAKLLDPNGGFLVLSLYAMGLSSLVGAAMIQSYFPKLKDLEIGELAIPEASGRLLPLSAVVRGFC